MALPYRFPNSLSANGSSGPFSYGSALYIATITDPAPDWTAGGNTYSLRIFKSSGDPNSWAAQDTSHEATQADGKGAYLIHTAFQALQTPQIITLGHSYSTGYPTNQAGRYGALVAADPAFGPNGSEWCLGDPASTACTHDGGFTGHGGYVRVLQGLTGGRNARSTVYSIWHGVNDVYTCVASNGGDMTPFAEAMRTIISRCLSSNIFEVTGTSATIDSTITLYGAWTGTVGTDKNSGPGYFSTTTNGTSVTIAVPSTFPGGTIALGFVGQAGGASCAIDVKGATTKSDTYTLATSQTIGSGSKYNGLVKRITGLNPGAHTIKLTFSSITGSGISFNYWQWESPLNPPVLLNNICRMPQDNVAYPLMTNALIAQGNGVLTSAVAEFGSNVRLLDADGVLNANLDLFQDYVHPNAMGHRLIYKAMMATGIMKAKADPVAHVAFTRNGATGLFYRTYDFSTDSWSPTETIYGAAIPGPANFTLAVRSTGEVVAAYAPSSTSVAYQRRSVERYIDPSTLTSRWGSATTVQGGSQTVTQIVSGVGASDRVHFVWNESTTPSIRHRSLDSANSLDTEAQTGFATASGSTSPLSPRLVSFNDGGTVKVRAVYTNGSRYALLKFTSGANPTFASEPVASLTAPPTVTVPAADLATVGTTIYVVATSAEAKQIFTTNKAGDNASWSTPQLALNGSQISRISASSIPRQGQPVLAFLSFNIVSGIGSYRYFEDGASFSRATIYSQPPGVSIKVQTLDGIWEQLGADRLKGIVAENVNITANQWGCDTASFTLSRRTDAIYPDLSAFTPIEIWVGGRKAWSGRLLETPTHDSESGRSISVSAQGWQYHLDDDVYQRSYVQTDITKAQDRRDMVGVSLTFATSGWAVDTGSGQIRIYLQNNVATSTCGGIVLDLGSPDFKRVVFTYTSGGWAAGWYLRTYAGNDPGGASATLLGTVNPPATGPATLAYTAPSPSRYLFIQMENQGGGTGVPNEPLTWTAISDLAVFSSTAYESGNASILKASDVVRDAVTTSTILLSSDKSAVTSTSFNIPDFAMDGYHTPRDAIEAVNSYHDYITQVDADRRIVFAPQATAPIFEVGAWSGYEFEDASNNSGDDIYNRVIVQGTAADGSALNVTRSAAGLPGVTFNPALQTLSNPSFTTNTTGWTAGGTSTITRDTGTYNSSPAAGRWDKTGASDALPVGATLTTTASGTFRAGQLYQVTLMVRRSTGSGVAPGIWVLFGSPPNDVSNTLIYPSSSWQTITAQWTPVVDRVGATITLTHYQIPSVIYWHVDDISLQEARPTLIDKRGFRRTKILPVSSSLSVNVANQLGDVYLTGHYLTQFRGSITTTGETAIRGASSGRPIDPVMLMSNVGQQIRLTDRVDPNTGALGRVGTIASASYDVDARKLSLELDNRRNNFEAFLSRLAVVTGRVQTP